MNTLILLHCYLSQFSVIIMEDFVLNFVSFNLSDNNAGVTKHLSRQPYSMAHIANLNALHHHKNNSTC